MLRKYNDNSEKCNQLFTSFHTLCFVIAHFCFKFASDNAHLFVTLCMKSIAHNHNP